MISVSAGLVSEMAGYLSEATQAFLPLLAATIGLFLAFTLARRTTDFIKRLI